MTLTTAQATSYQKLLNMGASKQAVAMTPAAVRTLIYISARDLGLLSELPPPTAPVPPFFDTNFRPDVVMPGSDPSKLYEAALSIEPELETYVGCLGTLHKYRLKYQQVVAAQPFATMDQVGPRALLQYGKLEARGLANFLVWRKWFYDLDNRAAQDTGYVFEPVIAAALAGVYQSAKGSPVRRLGDSTKGRQIDCLREPYAYEIKIRITIAASGQGRWKEELTFPAEASAVGLTPVLVVLDPTENPKLAELRHAYVSAGGHAFVGDAAWDHLKQTASSQMAVFLEKYIHEPLRAVVGAWDDQDALPEFRAMTTDSGVAFRVGATTWTVERPRQDLVSDSGVMSFDDNVATFD